MTGALGSLRLSVLDLAPISEGDTAADAYRKSLDLAQHADQWGYNRYWVAEHHNITPIASSATAVLIGHLAGGTERIRLGSGGIMLPNHAPLVIAEQFGTLASLYPGRIDLGLGRAPGTDPVTSMALRREQSQSFPDQVVELLGYLDPQRWGANNRVRAIPGEGLDIPVWLLGSSGFSAQLAARLGLPFSFAGHFSPSFTFPAIETYRENFEPSELLAEPYVMMGMNLAAADTDEQARLLFSSIQQNILYRLRGNRQYVQPPRDMAELWTDQEREHVEQSTAGSVVGGPDTITRYLSEYVDATGVDEIMFTSYMYDHADRLRSYEIASSLIQ